MAYVRGVRGRLVRGSLQGTACRARQAIAIATMILAIMQYH